MFTGIVKGLGQITHIEELSAYKIISIKILCDITDISLGDSIAINGVCLTVTNLNKNNKIITVDVVSETIEKTSLNLLKPGQTVNIEDSLKAGDKLGGHFVTGHVDSTANIIKINKTSGKYLIWFKAPDHLVKYIAPKGSITIDGMSLTVIEVCKNQFFVSLIPYTLEHTIAKHYQENSLVNIEVDLLARYLNQLTSPGK